MSYYDNWDRADLKVELATFINRFESTQTELMRERGLIAKLYPSEVTKLPSDEGILHGELFLDKDGKAHFICHTPGDMTFVEVKYALLAFIDLFIDQIERQEECPFYEKASEG